MPTMRIGINAHLLAFTENYRQAGLSRYIYELVTRAPRIDRSNRYTAFLGPAKPSQQSLEEKPSNLRLSPGRVLTVKAGPASTPPACIGRNDAPPAVMRDIESLILATGSGR